jgi:hypothetical protein
LLVIGFGQLNFLAPVAVQQHEMQHGHNRAKYKKYDEHKAKIKLCPNIPMSHKTCVSFLLLLLQKRVGAEKYDRYAFSFSGVVFLRYSLGVTPYSSLNIL